MPKPLNKLIIDYGGTWIRFYLESSFLFSRVPTIPLPQLPALIEKTLSQWKVSSLHELIVGAKGVWKIKDKNGLHRQLHHLAKKVTVLSDVELTHRSIFGNKAGIVLISGTGSIAYGKDRKGKFARAGGLGPQKGDEGSGYWIGKEYLKRTGKDWENKSVREVAALAKTVLKKYEKKDPLCTAIVQEAQKHLKRLILSVDKKLNLKKFPLHLHGGLFKNKSFRKLEM